MSKTSEQRSADFLKIGGQFKLGALVTESSHPVTANLSEVASRDISAALRLLFDVDDDVLRTFDSFVKSGRAPGIAKEVLKAVRNGGKIFFTGCGSTGRLSILLAAIWRDFWQQQGGKPGGKISKGNAKDLENRAFSVMAGGDFALIKSVEGFEDFADFGKKQIADLGVGKNDVVFAITEGGETSFVIGTAWKGLEAGAKVYFVYNNPDDVLCAHVQRSREVIQEPRIEKINLTTGPMGITGSTRMQATTIQLCVLLTVMEIAVRELLGAESAGVPENFLKQLAEMLATLKSPEVLSPLAEIVALEEKIYRAGGKNNYYADRLGIDVLTDTTERSPTYCTPPFRKFDDASAAESWAFLFVPAENSAKAWEKIIRREPNCVEWNETEVRQMVGEERFDRTLETVRKISRAELMRFKIGLDGLDYRPLKAEDSAIAILSEEEKGALESPDGFFAGQLSRAKKAGAETGLIYFAKGANQKPPAAVPYMLSVRVPESDFLLDGVARAGVKILLNTLSTCTMVRLGRVMGNFMIWVVASNLKLIDRSTRYISKLTGLPYDDANRLLFEVIEYVEPRMKADQSYPPVVGLAVVRFQQKLSNEEAERKAFGKKGKS